MSRDELQWWTPTVTLLWGGFASCRHDSTPATSSIYLLPCLHSERSPLASVHTSQVSPLHATQAGDDRELLEAKRCAENRQFGCNAKCSSTTVSLP